MWRGSHSLGGNNSSLLYSREVVVTPMMRSLSGMYSAENVFLPWAGVERLLEFPYSCFWCQGRGDKETRADQTTSQHHAEYCIIRIVCLKLLPYDQAGRVTVRPLLLFSCSSSYGVVQLAWGCLCFHWDQWTFRCYGCKSRLYELLGIGH